MLNARITRISTHPKYGTFGVFVLDGQPICTTLEPYKRDNASSVSCIPTGQYIMEVQNSPKFGNVYTITNVQGRSYIRVHHGNLDEHTEGCLLLGESFGEIGDDWAILSSGQAISELMEKSKGADIHLTIVESF